MYIKVHLTVFLLGIVAQCTDQALSEVCLEDSCINQTPSVFHIVVKEPSINDFSYTSLLKATRHFSYTPGRNCSVIFTSSYDIIISVKEIRFRPGCRDYLKISDKYKRIGLCGSKNEHDSNMQFYGDVINLNYYTERGGSTQSDWSGFLLYFTASQKKERCEALNGFKCSNGYCVNARSYCDGINNCGDFSDEKDCGNIETGTVIGAVVVVAMFLVSAMGLVVGFCTGVCVRVVWADCIKMYRSEREENETTFLCCSSESATAQTFLSCC